jgi:hypothetical protein
VWRRGQAPAPSAPPQGSWYDDGKIITTGRTITVRLDGRAYAPVLRQANLPDDTVVPWWGNRPIRYEIS